MKRKEQYLYFVGNFSEMQTLCARIHQETGVQLSYIPVEERTAYRLYIPVRTHADVIKQIIRVKEQN